MEVSYKIYENLRSVEKILRKFLRNIGQIFKITCEIFKLLKYLHKICEYNLKEALKISAGLFGKVLKILEKFICTKKLIKYSTVSTKFCELFGNF